MNVYNNLLANRTSGNANFGKQYVNTLIQGVKFWDTVRMDFVINTGKKRDFED